MLGLEARPDTGLMMGSKIEYKGRRRRQEMG